MAGHSGRVLLHTAVWAMAAALLSACAVRTATRLQTVDPSGVWEGEVRTTEARLPLTVSLERASSGWHGLVDVPSQYARQYPLMDARVDSGAIRFAFPDALPPGVFDGVVERGRIRGQFASPLGTDTLRGPFELWRRPPEAVPSTAEPIRFRNGNLGLRGTGESDGERWPQTSGTFADLADDASAGVRFLRDQLGVDANRIGLWGRRAA